VLALVIGLTEDLKKNEKVIDVVAILIYGICAKLFVAPVKAREYIP
jgi:hypothetical protein